MFYDVFKDLCNKNGETPNSVCLKLGFSPATAPYWKRSGRPPKREGLELIAEYFDVSIDYLLEKNDFTNIQQISSITTNAPIQVNRSEMLSILSKLSDSELDELLHYAEYLLSKRSNQAEPDNQ